MIKMDAATTVLLVSCLLDSVVVMVLVLGLFATMTMMERRARAKLLYVLVLCQTRACVVNK